MRALAAVAGALLMIPAVAAAADRHAQLQALRGGTPDLTESSNKQMRQLLDCVRKDAAWSGAARVRSAHGTALMIPKGEPKAALDIAEEGDRRRVTLWSTTAADADGAAAKRMAAAKACL